MSTSDSDYSIDWLASDEEDYDSSNGSSPRDGAELVSPSSSSSSSSSSGEPRTSCCPAAAAHSDSSDCRDGGSPSLSPLQGFTSVSTQQTLPVESRGSNRKRTHGASLDELCEKPQEDTEDELFSLKCSQLQSYIPPLSSILRSLRSGRYSERLSTFQEGVAMDRIQRILGVLQNPHTGGRFLSIVLKIEEMLQSWFPHIKPNPQTDGSSSAKKQKHHHHSASPPPAPPAPPCSSDVEPTASFSSSHLTWLHSSPVCSVKPLESTPGPLDPPCSQEVTQDNAVSSSTDSHTGPRCRSCTHPRLSQGALPFKISSPCLERLLQAKDSIIAPRTVGDGGWLS
ncbi:circadian-associated transcriptional repressor [Hippoglossus stenolepis]|uniref:circadian-associated transcriptional repressor n=1 Tax=Hippoglossus stenolepis TaxID=195615 RepID=UPI00159C7993|nr:circadian-associated transcriptional repressor [Hippoglossus stenolepis]